jgi:hypothetical protein
MLDTSGYPSLEQEVLALVQCYKGITWPSKSLKTGNQETSVSFSKHEICSVSRKLAVESTG